MCALGVALKSWHLESSSSQPDRLFLSRFLLLPTVLLFACATVPPTLTGAAPDPRFPAVGYLIGAGQSTDSQAAADAAAMGALVQRIDSRISSTFLDIESKDASGERETIKSKLYVKSEFSQARLIRVVDRGYYGGTYYALAALERSAAGRELSREYQPPARAFREAVALAQENQGNAVAFTAATRRALEAFRKLSPMGTELTALDPEAGRAFDVDRERLGTLLSLRQAVMQSISVSVTPETPTAADLAAALAKVVPALGLRLTDQSPTTTLVVSVDESWPPGLGVCVEWDATVTVDGTPMPLKTDLIGCHPKDKDLARQNLVDSLTADKLEAPLKAVLATVVPWED